MKIQFLTRYSGPKGTFQPGAEVNIDDETAADLIDAGSAVQIDEPKAAKPKGYETKATEPRTQTAAKAAAKPKAKARAKRSAD